MNLLNSWLVLLLLNITYTGIAQDKIVYDKVNYKSLNPVIEQNGLNRVFIKELVQFGVAGRCSKEELDSIVNVAWIAISNPLQIDSLYPEFSKNTLGGGEAVGNDGIIHKITKPWLAEWTAAESDERYFQLALEYVLSEFRIMSYADNYEGVRAAFSNLRQTKDLKIPIEAGNSGVIDYLRTINEKILLPINKIVLIVRDDFLIIVSNKDKKASLISAASRIGWELKEP